MRIEFFLTVFGLLINFAAANSNISDCQMMKNKEMEMELISTNIENHNTTKTEDGGPYKSKKLVCNENMCAIVTYKNAVKKYLPRHPDADSNGYVSFPDIDVLAELEAMISARGQYEQASRNCRAKQAKL